MTSLKSEIKIEDEQVGESTGDSSKKKKEKVFSEEKQKLLHTQTVKQRHINTAADGILTFDSIFRLS